MMSMMAVAVILTSCKGEEKTPDSEMVKGEYATEKLALQINGAVCEESKATIAVASEVSVNIKLENAIFGYPVIEAKGIAVSTTKSTTYYIKGSYKQGDLTLNLEGNVVGDKLTLAVTQVYTAPFVGEFIPTRGEGEFDWETGYDPQNECMYVSLVTPKPTVSFMGNMVAPAIFTNFIKGMLAGYIAPEVTNVTFSADGTYSVSVVTEVPFPIVGRYAVLENGVVDLEIPAAVLGMLEGLELPGLSDLKSLPFNFKKDGDKYIFFVNKEMMTPFLEIILAMLPSEPTGDVMLDMMIGAMRDMKVIMTDATSFDLGLSFAKK